MTSSSVIHSAIPSAQLLVADANVSPERGAVAGRTKLRLPFLDFMRAIASQCIVLHHLVFYGPLPERAQNLCPAIFDWFYAYARMAVQVFLVLGGYFTSRSLSRLEFLDTRSMARAIGGRYRRIAVPYLFTLLVAVVANEVARALMTHEAISERPTALQLLAHAVFMHDVLGFEALSAGIWYLAIDFQLFLLTLLLFAVSQRLSARGRNTGTQDAYRRLLALMLPLALVSLFWFNRHPEYDIWAIYFVGAYFLGIVLHGVLELSEKLKWAAAYWAMVVLAGLVDPRPRLFVAAGTALVVFLAARSRLLHTWPKSAALIYLGRISYSLFLIHFPVLLVVNAWGSRHLLTTTAAATGGLLLAYLLSLVAGVVLYHGVESRLR